MSAKEYHKVSELAREYLESKVNTPQFNLSTGIKSLDKLQKQWLPGLYSIAGAPGVGKTTFAVYISRALGQSNPEFKVIYATEQQSTERILEKTLLSDVYQLNPKDSITHQELFEGHTTDTYNQAVEYAKESSEEFYVLEWDGFKSIKELTDTLKGTNYIIVWDMCMSFFEDIPGGDPSWSIPVRRWAHNTNSLVFVINRIPRAFYEEDLSAMCHNVYVPRGTDVVLELQSFDVENPNFTTSIVLEDRTVVNSVHLWKLYCKYNRFNKFNGKCIMGEYITQIAWKPEVWTIIPNVKMKNKHGSGGTEQEIYSIADFWVDQRKLQEEERLAKAREQELLIESKKSIGCYGKQYDDSLQECQNCKIQKECLNHFKIFRMKQEVVMTDPHVYTFTHLEFKSIDVILYNGIPFVRFNDLKGKGFIGVEPVESIRVAFNSMGVPSTFKKLSDVILHWKQTIANTSDVKWLQKRNQICERAIEWFTSIVIPSFNKS